MPLLFRSLHHSWRKRANCVLHWCVYTEDGSFLIASACFRCHRSLLYYYHLINTLAIPCALRASDVHTCCFYPADMCAIATRNMPVHVHTYIRRAPHPHPPLPPPPPPLPICLHIHTSTHGPSARTLVHAADTRARTPAIKRVLAKLYGLWRMGVMAHKRAHTSGSCLRCLASTCCYTRHPCVPVHA